MQNDIQSEIDYEMTVNDEQFHALVLFLQTIKEQYTVDDIAFVCIGTDRSTGDAFGPLIGTMLKNKGFTQVYGTLQEPCDADYVGRIIKQLGQTGKKIIAIDACLGAEKSVGSFLINNGPLVPGAGVGRKLPPVGEFSIAAVVNKHGLKSYWQLQHTSLYFIYRMCYTLELAMDTAWKEWKTR